MQTPTVKLPKLEYSDFLWICAGLIACVCLYLSISEWQRNKIFKVTQDRLTMAYETQIYQAYKEQTDGLIHDRATVRPTVDEYSGPDIASDTQDSEGPEPIG